MRLSSINQTGPKNEEAEGRVADFGSLATENVGYRQEPSSRLSIAIDDLVDL